MILDALDLTPGLIESGSPNQPLNPDHSIDPPGFLMHHAYPSEDGARVFIQDEITFVAGFEPVQMWTTASTPAYVDGIELGGGGLADVPFVLPAHNLLVSGERLYVGWYKAGLQAFDFDSTGFIGRPIYHQAQTEPTDGASEGAWAVRLAVIESDIYVFQSDRRYGLIVDRVDFCSSLANAGQPNTDGDGVIDACDNCPAWPNSDQSLPPWPVTLDGSDPDCDGFTTADENFMGTLPEAACAVTNTANDDGSPDAWPFDFNDDQRAALGDVIGFIPVFNTFAPSLPYESRYDLNASGGITLADVMMYIPVFNMTCTP